MANQVAARLAGDDYQHLLAWLQILELRMPASDVRSVIVEDPDAAHVDDVTTLYVEGSGHPDEYFQVKYHTDQRNQYSTELLLNKKTPKGRSLLEKFFATWKVLSERGSRNVELRLVSNWTWNGSNDIGGCIEGTDNALSEEFFSAGETSKMGKVRERWRNHLAVEADEFAAFARTLRFRLGFDCFEEVEDRVSERMMFLKFKFDRVALALASSIVRDLVKSGRTEVTAAKLDEILERYDLFAPTTQEAAAVIFLTTVKTQQFEVEPDFHLDWRTYFEGDAAKTTHRVKTPGCWNVDMLPALHRLEADLNDQKAPRFIKARGLARLSAWFAFGHTFSDVARYTIEVDQQGELWRTDAAPTDVEAIEHTRDQIPNGDASAVAVGISVTGALDDDVRNYLREMRATENVLFLRPNRELGRNVFTCEGDVVGFATTAKNRLRAFAKEHRATRLLLFYFGPLSGACFIGHQLNAVAQEIQIMEDLQPGYAPSFLLT